MSQQEISQDIPYCLCKSETMFKVLKGLEFKGGSSKINALKIAVMLDDTNIKEALDAAIILKFVELNDDSYALTDSGETLVNEGKTNQQEMVADAVIGVEAYKDIIYRMKMSDGFIKEKDVGQAFYILSPEIREEIRKRILSSFASFCIYAKIFESNSDRANPGYNLTKKGEITLQSAIGGKEKSTVKTTSSAGGALTCGSCGKSINPDFIMCPYCGAPQKGECSNCGKELLPGFKMCPYCGTPR
ncbi:MAG: zinc-ribbon domain-containing protein [Promethearchaeota archaeon]